MEVRRRTFVGRVVQMAKVITHHSFWRKRTQLGAVPTTCRRPRAAPMDGNLPPPFLTKRNQKAQSIQCKAGAPVTLHELHRHPAERAEVGVQRVALLRPDRADER